MNYVLSFDLDDTLANTNVREDEAKILSQGDNAKFWKYLLYDSLYHLDTPIPEGYNFITEYAKKYPQVHIIYISGRPASSYDQTKEWLERYHFPQGTIFLRPSGRTRTFKTNTLRQLKQRGYKILAHIGDNPVDDIEAAQDAGVKGILIGNGHKWPRVP